MTSAAGSASASSPSVLLVLPDLSGGGAERTSLNVRQRLSVSGRNVKLALLEERGEYLEQVSADQYVLPARGFWNWIARRCPADSPQRALAQVPLLMGLLRKESPDVIMTSMADVTVPLAMAFVLMPGRRRKTRWIARRATTPGPSWRKPSRTPGKGAGWRGSSAGPIGQPMSAWPFPGAWARG